MIKQSLQELYSAKSDEELLTLAADKASLTEDAKSLLAFELQRRNLKQPRWNIPEVDSHTSRRKIPISVRIVNGAMAIACATLPVEFARALLPTLQLIPAVLTFIVLAMCFYRLGIWFCIDRPGELRKKLPITSKELRKRRKAFHDWLASQGRRERGKRRRHSA